MDDCFKANCTGFLGACLEDGTNGDKTCASSMGCFDQCSLGKDAPFTCMAACYNALDKANKALLGTFATCANKAVGEGKDPEKVCVPEMLACVAGGKTGTKGCWELFPCLKDCQAKGGTEDACVAQCVQQLSKEGQEQFLAMTPCFDKEDDPTCLDKYMACAAPSGTKSCLDSFDCLTKCQQPAKEGEGGDDPSCMFVCLHDASPAAAKSFGALMPCMGSDLSKPECIAALDTCIDAKGTATCLDTLKCTVGCQVPEGQPDPGPMCMFKCAEKASKTAASAFLAASACMDKNTPECGTALMTCVDAKGTKSCAEIAKCIVTCPAQGGGGPSATCPWDCIAQGTKESAAAGMQLLTCGGGSQCLGVTTACAKPSGTDTCNKIAVCVDTCAKGGSSPQACTWDCVPKASAKGADDWFKFASCNGTCEAQCKGSVDPGCHGACLGKTCPAELLACSPPST
jgi:hypothetical protein